MNDLLMSAVPIISMGIVWSYHYLKTKSLKYWLLVISANFLWATYCIYCLFDNPSVVVKNGLITILVDNAVSIGISIYGIMRMYRVKYANT